MLIVIAEKEELKLVEELGYSNYPVLITGCGGANVINALKDLPRDTEILNIGYCGSKLYKVGDIVSIFKIGTYHTKARFGEPTLFLSISKIDDSFKSTACYSSTDFVENIDITPYDEDCVFDMELAFIRAMFDNVSAIKVVSDNLNKKEYDKNSQIL